MKAAISRLPESRISLINSLNEYIFEETGHEEWILEDIRNAGGNADAARDGRPLLATELMIAYAYDYINRINPAGLFGMIYVLESTSTALATAAAHSLSKSLDLPNDCFRYLTSHGALDVAHIQFFKNAVAHVEYGDDRDAIVHIAKRMYVLFANVFRSIPLSPSDRHDIF